jgi:hypothetical protein
MRPVGGGCGGANGQGEPYICNGRLTVNKKNYVIFHFLTP